VPSARFQVLRWIDDEPQPGFIEVSLVDCHGRDWRFIDKTSIFSAQAILSTSDYPIAIAIDGHEVSRSRLADGSEVVTVNFRWLESVEGMVEFDLRADQFSCD